MSDAAFVVLAINFVLIGALPRVFFKKGGKLNMRWWLTASPFVVAALSAAAGYAGVAVPPIEPWWRVEALEAGSALMGVASIALIAYTLGTHHRPIALWHQEDDAPEHIVTHGAYARIRHPFYASFLLALAGAFLASSQPFTLAALLYAAVALNVTAAREERRLADSAFGAEYRAYMERTGRFLPRLRAARERARA